MNNRKNLTETDIKQALKEGHITRQEARQMLMAYIQKADFMPMKYPFSNEHKASYSTHC